MRFSLAELIAVTGANLAGPAAPDLVVDGVSIDSRSIKPGELFVAITAERDGHEFIGAAVDAGAGAYLCSRPEAVVEGTAALIVADTGEALTAIGRAARARHDGPVIGITGSVGKTSVKDLTAAAIGASRRCHANPASFNNELGVPLTLANAPEATEVLVVEMGARGAGHIRELCDLAQPSIGIVTWVGAVHTSEFGTVEAVAAAKSELVESLPAAGTAILNADCEAVAAMAAATSASVWTYGIGRGDVTVGAADTILDEELRPRFTAHIEGRALPVDLAVRGEHQVANALAALAAAVAVGVRPEDAVDGLANGALSPWRMEFARTRAGTAIINDAYNANAISTAAALRSLATLSAVRRVAVLGTMAELGDRHDRDHEAMSQLCDELGIELIAFREGAYGPDPVDNFDEVRDLLGGLGPDDAVLVKASRVAGLESLADRLLAE